MDLYRQRVVDSQKMSKSRFVKNKQETFKRALNRSYSSERVRMGDREFDAIITSIPTNPKITKKNFSTLKDFNCRKGKEVYWIEDDSHWLITEHDASEHAIFQGSIEKSIYELKWKDPIKNITYNARACAKGPDNTTISDGVKHSIFFDTLSDTLYLIVSSLVEGAELLERYFTLMVNNRKWKIEVVDDMTDNNLLYLQLKEVLIDRDRDDEDLVGGKEPDNFIIKSLLDEIDEISIGEQITLKPMLLKNDIVINEDDYKIYVSNCNLEEQTITFNQEGLAEIIIESKNFHYNQKWQVNVKEESLKENISQKIIGSAQVKTFMTVEYSFTNTINGKSQVSNGNWTVDENYFEIKEEDSDKIVLKIKNQTGSTDVEYNIDGEIFTKEVKVIPLFGGG